MVKLRLPQSKEERAAAYLRVLFEIDARVHAIKVTMTSDWPAGMSREICQLQLRHICELVAIGCAVIQGEYQCFSIGEWKPKNIFRALSAKYEGFFPQSAVITKAATGTDIRCNVVPGCVTRSEIEAIWERTGNVLHRLSVKSYFREDEAGNKLADVEESVVKIKTLLDSRAIPMHGSKILVVAGLGFNNGRPGISYYEYNDNQTMSVAHFDLKGPSDYWK